MQRWSHGVQVHANRSLKTRVLVDWQAPTMGNFPEDFPVGFTFTFRYGGNIDNADIYLSGNYYRTELWFSMNLEEAQFTWLQEYNKTVYNGNLWEKRQCLFSYRDRFCYGLITEPDEQGVMFIRHPSEKTKKPIEHQEYALFYEDHLKFYHAYDNGKCIYSPKYENKKADAWDEKAWGIKPYNPDRWFEAAEEPVALFLVEDHITFK